MSEFRNRAIGASFAISFATACVAPVVLAVVAAKAADAPVRAAAAAVSAPAYDWSGFYFGGHLGYGRGGTSSTLFDPFASSMTNSFGSAFGGMHGGYNYVLPSRLMLGIEGDISFANFYADSRISWRPTTNSAVSEEIDAIATLRGRIGYAFDRVLVYGTGGFAWSQARLQEDPGILREQDKFIRTRGGWTAGGGVEFAIAPQWSARLEYLYDRFNGISGVFPSSNGYQSTYWLQTVRLGLTRKLGPAGDGPAAIDAKDSWPIASNDWNVHGQATFIGQGYPQFHSPYQGQNSLSGPAQYQNTTSATAFLGLRLPDSTEFYINPELMQGSGLSQTFGLGGYSNGEAQKSGFPVPRINIARVFLKHTIGFGGEQETVEDGPNQLPGKQDISRLTIIAGEMAVIDYFDGNSYSHDPRRDFLNWNLYCCGSYDLTMNKVGYTWGAYAELNQKFWALRAGYFLLPTSSNVNSFDMHIPSRGQYIAELELRYSLWSQPGKFRVMGYANRGNAGGYADAVALPIASPNYPDITLTRRVRTNPGVAINIEQAITDQLGVFGRASKGGGQTEKLGWTDVDASVSAGAVLKGAAWERPDDRVGVGGIVDALSHNARIYFENGGLGILIGDGALNYRHEKILEAFYAYAVNKYLTASLDYQFITNPAYNADRGPVSIFATRLHAEF